MTAQPPMQLPIAGRRGGERRGVEQPAELVEHRRDMHILVGVDPADHALGLRSSSSVIMVVPPVLLKVEAASNSREGGQDREWA